MFNKFIEDFSFSLMVGKIFTAYIIGIGVVIMLYPNESLVQRSADLVAPFAIGLFGATLYDVAENLGLFIRYLRTGKMVKKEVAPLPLA